MINCANIQFTLIMPHLSHRLLMNKKTQIDLKTKAIAHILLKKALIQPLAIKEKQWFNEFINRESSAATVLEVNCENFHQLIQHNPETAMLFIMRLIKQGEPLECHKLDKIHSPEKTERPEKTEKRERDLLEASTDFNSLKLVESLSEIKITLNSIEFVHLCILEQENHIISSDLLYNFISRCIHQCNSLQLGTTQRSRLARIVCFLGFY